ncbi:PIG-L family deacetylase [Aeromonas hydrophila]|uniref:PIG-L family deacetylase n=1 Tax=Aeromonas hydrophila TaxID=644 RepID=UPI001B39ECCF|nr:PIG-L family deacetylase [Aeromonas hydrophila]MBQ4676534.1 hypothetical protein [Aeromonas hydrophila]MBW3813139.1 hypothetical protein [Aeromonas hydrophila]MCF7678371.1 PIG-L family deacetylase [Aeromonas hydrophila]MCF7691419.1 PIG-L family deacetylase [Aeromonas hydrophila]MCF7774149.1 PIG-L family deacetylase [Aeromonas hydrophila]
MKIHALSLLLSLGFSINSFASDLVLPNGTKIISELPAASKDLEPSPSTVGAKAINYDYCNNHERLLTVIAHADDDRYFMGDNIRQAISNGACVKIVHVNAGFDIHPPADANSFNSNDPFYYQGRINGARAVYANLVSDSFNKPVYETNSWDEIEGDLVQRYILSTGLDGDKPSEQIIEIQILGLPNSSNVTSFSGAGNTVSHIYSNNEANTINIASEIDGYNIPNRYNWDSVVAKVDLIMQWMNPNKILTLDPWGVPGDDGVEGQHPDHIIAARIVNSTDYAKTNPDTISYFKTYNVNVFKSNLSSSTANKTEADLDIHFTHDWGSSFITNNPCSSSLQSGGVQFTPFSWACKEYKATQNEYFVTKNIKNINQQCLNSSDNKNVQWGACNETSLPVTIGKSRFAYISNSTSINNNEHSKLVLYPAGIISGASISLIDFKDMPNNARWHYNDASNNLEFHYVNANNQKEIFCLDVDSKNGAIISECNKNDGVNVDDENDATLPNGSYKILNRLSNQCVAVKDSSLVMASCSDTNTLWQKNNEEVSQLVNGELKCLNAPVFGAGVAAIELKTCHTTSPGQKFDVKSIPNTNIQTIRPINDGICLENDLKFYECHGYKVQQWSFVK